MSTQLTLLRASEVNGLPVVTIAGGDDAAEIRDVVYDAARHQLIGFTLNKRGWLSGSLKATLEAANIVANGPDAVMVADESCLTAAGESPDALGTSDAVVDVMGDSVVTASGTVIGTVVDVIIESGTKPTAVGYEVAGDNGSVFIPASAQMSISGDNLMVPAEAEQFTSNDLVGFGGAVQSFRDLLDQKGTS